MKLQRQRQAERLEKLTLEEEVQQQKECLAAEAARIEAELLQQAMVCYGKNDPFSSDAREMAHSFRLVSYAYSRVLLCVANMFAHTDEVARFAKDVRTGCVIRCADGITRVVYSLDEARKVISARNFKNERQGAAPAAVRAA